MIPPIEVKAIVRIQKIYLYMACILIYYVLA
jgi:hypothetical protein